MHANMFQQLEAWTILVVQNPTLTKLANDNGPDVYRRVICAV